MRATRSASGTPCFRSERHDLAPRPRLACGFHRAGGRRRAGRSERHVAPRAAGLRQPRVPSGGVARPGRAARAADRSRARAGVRAARLHVRRPGLDPQGSGRIQAGRPDRSGATARPEPRFAQGVQRVRRRAAPGVVGAAAAGRQHELCGGTGGGAHPVHGDPAGAGRDAGNRDGGELRDRLGRLERPGEPELARPAHER